MLSEDFFDKVEFLWVDHLCILSFNLSGCKAELCDLVKGPSPVVTANDIQRRHSMETGSKGHTRGVRNNIIRLLIDLIPLGNLLVNLLVGRVHQQL